MAKARARSDYIGLRATLSEGPDGSVVFSFSVKDSRATWDDWRRLVRPRVRRTGKKIAGAAEAIELLRNELEQVGLELD